MNLKGPGITLHAGDEFGAIETIKVNVSLPSPESGSVLRNNKALELSPEFVNEDPYGKGWLIELKATDWEMPIPISLTRIAYFDFMKTEIASELKGTPWVESGLSPSFRVAG